MINLNYFLDLLLVNLPQSQNTSKNNENVSASPSVSPDLSPLFNISEGHMLRGTVTDLRPNLVTLVLHTGESFSARTGSPLPLAIGDTADFVIASKDSGKVTLKYVETVAKDNIDKQVTYKKPDVTAEKNANSVERNVNSSERNENLLRERSESPKEQLPPGIESIPFTLPEDKGSGDIYVSGRDRSTPSDDTDSVFLHFALSGLGNTDILVLRDRKLLSVSFSVESEEAKKALADGIPAFSSALSKKGFSVSSDIFVNKDGNTDLFKRFSDRHSRTDSKRMVFDIRI